MKVIHGQAVKFLTCKQIIIAWYRISNLATEHRSVVPAEIQFGIGCKASQLSESFVPVFVIEKEDEFLFPFDQRKYVDFFIHVGGCPEALSGRSRRFFSACHGSISAQGPPEDEIAFRSSTPRFKHFCNVQVTTEMNEIIATL
jgi:hypothetical protein